MIPSSLSFFLSFFLIKWRDLNAIMDLLYLSLSLGRELELPWRPLFASCPLSKGSSQTQPRMDAPSSIASVRLAFYVVFFSNNRARRRTRPPARQAAKEPWPPPPPLLRNFPSATLYLNCFCIAEVIATTIPRDEEAVHSPQSDQVWMQLPLCSIVFITCIPCCCAFVCVWFEVGRSVELKSFFSLFPGTEPASG